MIRRSLLRAGRPAPAALDALIAAALWARVAGRRPARRRRLELLRAAAARGSRTPDSEGRLAAALMAGAGRACFYRVPAAS